MTDYVMVGACRFDPDSRQRRDRANAWAYGNLSRLDCYEGFLRGEISYLRRGWIGCIVIGSVRHVPPQPNGSRSSMIGPASS